MASAPCPSCHADAARLPPWPILPWRILSWLLALLTGTAAVAAAQEPPAEPEPPAEGAAVEEVLVVTAGRTEQRLHEVPAAMTVLSGELIEALPSDDYGDLLRNVPGLNVAQMSARDIQVTGRQATSSLANRELVLVDGRTLYLDFLGFVMWDLLPLHRREIKQIEVVRGPGSAVWGANALAGVINVITKAPAEMAGTSLIVGAGALDTVYGSVTHAATSDKLGYKFSGGYYEQDPYDRPTGRIPGTTTPYPPFQNQGTAQPKADARLDYNPSAATRFTAALGYAGTDGIIHSGIGPFDIERDSSLSYGRMELVHRALRIGLYANLLDGDAANLLTQGATGAPLFLGFDSETLNFDVSNTTALGKTHILTYGANARRSNFDLTIAPLGEQRDELGAFFQDEIFLGNKLRWLIGARVDDIDPLDTVVSPRTSLMISPAPQHTVRLSYNQAFRAPALVENYLDTTITNQILLPAFSPLGIFQPILFSFPTDARGNPALGEEELTAYEAGYVTTFGRGSSFSLALYRNELERAIDFYPASFYDSSRPPPRWPLPPFLLDLPPLQGALPALFTYRNIGEIINQGIELALELQLAKSLSGFFNYSYQEAPEVTGIAASEVNLPPENRFNLGLAYNGAHFFASGNVNYVDEAFWADVLDARFHGPTEAYTQFNVALGVRLLGERLSLAVIGQNVFDETVQQHVFGDLISRKVVGQLGWDF